MKRLTTLTLTLFGAFALTFATACSDDTTPTPTRDSATIADTGAAVDTGATGDVATSDGTTGDATAAGTKTCSEVSTCSDTCAAACPNDANKIACMVKCSTDCKATGCESAQTAFGALYLCIAGHCATDCMAGGSSTSCKTCVDSQCATENTACIDNKC